MCDGAVPGAEIVGEPAHPGRRQPGHDGPHVIGDGEVGGFGRLDVKPPGKLREVAQPLFDGLDISGVADRTSRRVDGHEHVRRQSRQLTSRLRQDRQIDVDHQVRGLGDREEVARLSQWGARRPHQRLVTHHRPGPQVDDRLVPAGDLSATQRVADGSGDPQPLLGGRRDRRVAELEPVAAMGFGSLQRHRRLTQRVLGLGVCCGVRDSDADGGLQGEIPDLQRGAHGVEQSFRQWHRRMRVGRNDDDEVVARTACQQGSLRQTLAESVGDGAQHLIARRERFRLVDRLQSVDPDEQNGQRPGAEAAAQLLERGSPVGSPVSGS